MIVEGSPLARYLQPPTLAHIRARCAERAAVIGSGALAQSNADCEYLLAEIDRLEQLMAHARWQPIYDFTRPVIDEPVLLQLAPQGGGARLYDVGTWTAQLAWAHPRAGLIQRVARIRAPPDWR